MYNDPIGLMGHSPEHAKRAALQQVNAAPADVKAPESEIEYAYRELVDSVRRLSSRVDVLAERLKPVLIYDPNNTPINVSETHSPPTRSFESGLGKGIDDVRRQLDQMDSYLCRVQIGLAL